MKGVNSVPLQAARLLQRHSFDERFNVALELPSPVHEEAPQGGKPRIKSPTMVFETSFRFPGPEIK